MSEEYNKTGDSRTLHFDFKLPQTQSKAQIVENYQQINDILEKMNRTIVRIFKYKEKELTGTIKKSISAAQDEVQKLTQLTTEEEVQRKLQLKRQEIEEQRQLILQSSMEFSNKCIEYKKSLQRITTTTKDLISEVQFLDDQLKHAKITNQKLKDKLEAVKTKPIQQQYFTQVPNKEPEPQIKGVQEQYDIAISELGKARKTQLVVQSILEDGAFQETQVETIFLECVTKVKKMKQQGDLQKLAMQSKSQKQMLKPIQALKAAQKQAEELHVQDQFFSDIELSDMHKRMVFEEFLSRSEIKALIYNLL